MKSPKPKRRWLKLSLRTLLILLTIGCIWLGWTVNRARQQRAAVEWVTEIGGKIYYDFETDQDGYPSRKPGRPPGPAWLRDWVGVDYLATVEGVAFSSTNRLDDISPLGTLVRLRYLHLDRTNVGNIEPLASLTQLASLSLERTKVRDLSPIANLRKLRRLNLSNNAQITDVEPLAKLSNLQDLDLSKTGVRDVEFLGNLRNLKSLKLNSTSVADISPLKDLVQLGYVNLGYTNVREIEPLGSLVRITYLDLGCTYVSSIEPLGNLTQLKHLDLKFTDVSNLTPIENLTKLKNVQLGHTVVSEADVEKLQQRLKNTNVSGSRWFGGDRPRGPQRAGVGLQFEQASEPSTVGSVTLVYDPRTGDVKLNAGDGVSIEALELRSDGGLFIPENTRKKATTGRFDIVTIWKVFMLERTSGLTKVDYGPILPKGLTFEEIHQDTRVGGSLMATSGETVSLGNRPPMLYIMPGRQPAAAKSVTDVGGKVYYDFEIGEDGLPTSEAERLPDPAWLRTSGDMDFLVAKVEGVDLSARARTSSDHSVDLSPLSSFPNLRYLNLRSAHVKDLSPLRNLKRLEHLDLSETNVIDLEPLRHLVRLENLELTRTNVSDIGPLSNLTQLKSLSLYGTKVTDLKPIPKNVVDLNLNRNPQIIDIEPLANLTGLTELHLAETGVADVKALSDLPNLSELSLSDTPLSDTTPLANLKTIRRLFLNNTAVTNVSPLKSLVGLEYLALDETEVQDLSALSHLVQLKTLNLNGTRVQDIGPLSSLTQLQHLRLGGTRVTDLTPIENLKLVRLNLAGNPQIKDVKTLTQLIGLENLNLQGTRVSEADYELLQQKLKNTEVSWSKFTPQDAEFTRASEPSTPGSVTMVYDPNTGDVSVNSGDGVSIKALQLTSAGSLLLPGYATKQATEGAFDSVTSSRALKLDRDDSFTELKYGPILPKDLDYETIRSDMKIRGSLIGRDGPMALRDTTPLLFVVSLKDEMPIKVGDQSPSTTGSKDER